MDRDTLVAAMDAVVREHGPWGANNVRLPHGVFTIGPEPRGDNYRAVKFLQLVQDMATKPLSDLRILDLGSGEGLYSLEFGLHGARVLGVEGRAASLAKAEFCRQALGLDRVEFIQGDVRDVSVATHGMFDVILCSGILYHLNNPDAFVFLKALKAMCSGLCVIDTCISRTGEEEARFEGGAYRGSTYKEHQPGLTPEQKLADMGASLDNDESFWITRHDLANLLMDLGFTSVSECLGPVPLKFKYGRTTLVAVAGRKAHAHNEIGHGLADRRWPALWGADMPGARPHPDETP